MTRPVRAAALLVMWPCVLMAQKPYNEADFRRMRVTETWQKYAGDLSWGKGQCLAILDDGCDLAVPQWQASLPWGRKNAYIAAASMILREAVAKTGYDWRGDGPNLPLAMMRIFQETGADVYDPATKLHFERLDLLAAVDHVFGHRAAGGGGNRIP